jgi:signal transduction histidine kinase
MLFRKISYRIALQFMTFVFLLFLINGAIFLAADFSNARRALRTQLTRTAFLVLQIVEQQQDIAATLPRQISDRVRIINPSNVIVYQGNFFRGIPPPQEEGMSTTHVENEEYAILTTRVLQNGKPLGIIQVADVERSQFGDLPYRSLIYLFVSVGVSGITFFVGLFFARRSLKPAEQTMERLEQFTQDASHELRTPIAALSSSLDLALRNQKYREGILSAKEDLEEISTLVERLLELARLDQFMLKREEIDLSRLVEDSVERFRALAAEKNVDLQSTVTAGITAKGDPALLRQVLTNLISNAIKFSKPEGGTVTVRLTKKALSIQDTGIGIAQESLVHIFDRFYQAENSRTNDGYGLGLALVKRIIDLHRWTISAKSTLDKGTTFVIGIDS